MHEPPLRRFRSRSSFSPASAQIASFTKTMQISHHVKPKPGLCHAHNKALDVAIELGVCGIGSVDDDRIIDENWLLHMLKATQASPDTDMPLGQWPWTAPAYTPACPPLRRPALSAPAVEGRRHEGLYQKRTGR